MTERNIEVEGSDALALEGEDVYGIRRVSCRGFNLGFRLGIPFGAGFITGVYLANSAGLSDEVEMVTGFVLGTAWIIASNMPKFTDTICQATQENRARR